MRLRPALASLQLVRSDLGHMTQEFEAKYAQSVKDAECPEDFRDSLKKEKLINIESFGRAAPTEAKFMTEVAAVATSDGVAFKAIGEQACVATLWASCRDALNSGSSGGLARVVSDPAQGLGEGTEKTIKELDDAPLLGIV